MSVMSIFDRFLLICSSSMDLLMSLRYLNSQKAGSRLQKSKTREQLTAERVKEEFSRVDENSDGTLSREEMKMLLRRGNPEITEEVRPRKGGRELVRV